MSEGYTLKEMVSEIRSENREALKVQEHIVSTLESVDKHLERLNSKVATHEKKIGTLEAFQTKAMVVWSFVVFVAVTVVNRFV